METTLSGHAHLSLFAEARAKGLGTGLLYFSVRSPDISLTRIARRVAEGGHDVPEALVRRRFDRSHANLATYLAAADLWRIYEASDPRPCLIAEGQRSRLVHLDTECLARANAAIVDLVGRLRS